jgi:hypothetical protein
MLPKITKNKFSSGYDKCQYFGELLDNYININKSTHEPITEYNTMCISLINSAITEKLNPTIVKLVIIGRLAYKAEDYGTNRSCYQIISSLQKQRSYYGLCKSTLERAAINKNYYIVIKYNLDRGIVNRCKRLNESLLPRLVEDSKLNVYIDYLAERNTTLEKDFKKYIDCDFESEEFLHYVDLVEKRIERHLSSVSEEKKSKLLAGFEKQKLLAKQHREAKSVAKDCEKEDRAKEIKDNLSGVVTRIYNNTMIIRTTYMRKGSNAQKLYQKIDYLIEHKGVKACMNDRVVILALHPRNKNFSQANIKYYVSSKEALVTNIVLASMLLEKHDIQEIKNAVEKYKDEYIIDLGYANRADEYIAKVGAAKLEELRIIEIEKNKQRLEQAHSLGLGDDATWGDINNTLEERRILEREKMRKEKALSLGLDENATWADIDNFIEEQERLERERIRIDRQAKVDALQRSLPALPIVADDIAFLAKKAENYSDIYCFNTIVPTLHCLCYSYCDKSILCNIPDCYMISYYKSLYAFTFRVYVYYRNLYGIAYKLNGRIDDFKAFSKDFKTCFARLGTNYHYYEPRIEDARNLAINCLDYLSAIKSEGFSTQNAFKDFPLLERYYKKCSLSSLEIFMNVFSSGTADIKTFYTVLAKVKRELSKTD